MVLHIFGDSVFSKAFIENHYLMKGKEKSLFLIISDESEFEKYRDIDKRIIHMNQNKVDPKKLKFLFSLSRVIIIHSMAKPFVFIVWLSMQKKYHEKTIPIFWGADLYELNRNTKYDNIKNSVINIVRYKCVEKIYKNILNVGCIIPEDYGYFLKKFKTHAKYKPVIYSMDYFNNGFVDLLSTLEFKRINKNKVSVCIGHSANTTLNHVQTVEYLKKYENISMILPLSYGDKNYINDVVDKVSIYSNIKILTEFMDFHDYVKFCNTIDLLILNSTRQIALGNIYIFLLLKKSVCLPRHSTNYQFLNKYLGIDIVALEDIIEGSSCLDLSIYKIDVEKNYRIIKQYVSQENFVTLWNEILNL